MSDSAIPEELIALLHAISDDAGLCAWLLGLEQLPLVMRQAELWRMAAAMRAGGEEPALIEAVSALAQPHVYEAACYTLRER